MSTTASPSSFVTLVAPTNKSRKETWMNDVSIRVKSNEESMLRTQLSGSVDWKRTEILLVVRYLAGFTSSKWNVVHSASCPAVPRYISQRFPHIFYYIKCILARVRKRQQQQCTVARLFSGCCCSTSWRAAVRSSRTGSPDPNTIQWRRQRSLRNPVAPRSYRYRI
jgi:hypothetical protein